MKICIYFAYFGKECGLLFGMTFNLTHYLNKKTVPPFRVMIWAASSDLPTILPKKIFLFFCYIIYTIALNVMYIIHLMGVASLFCYTWLHPATPFWASFGLICGKNCNKKARKSAVSYPDCDKKSHKCDTNSSKKTRLKAQNTSQKGSAHRLLIDCSSTAHRLFTDCLSTVHRLPQGVAGCSRM